MEERQIRFKYLLMSLAQYDDRVIIMDDEEYGYRELQTPKATEIYDDLKARLDIVNLRVQHYGFKRIK